MLFKPSKLRILKVRGSKACALFQYNCTPNTSRNAYVSMNVDSHARRVNSFATWVILFCCVRFNDVLNYVKSLIYHLKRQKVCLCCV